MNDLTITLTSDGVPNQAQLLSVSRVWKVISAVLGRLLRMKLTLKRKLILEDAVHVIEVLFQ